MVAVGLKLRCAAAADARARARSGAEARRVSGGGPGIAWALGAPPLVKQVATLEAAMPTMVSAGALMMAYGVASQLAAAFVGWGLLISLGTVPLWAALLRR